MAVGQGQTLSLIGGTTINTGTVWTPGGKITIAAMPGTSQVQLSQEGMVLSLKLNAANLNNNGLSPESLPGLLTGRNSVSATEVSVDANGQVWLTGSNTQIPKEAEKTIVSGTVDASNPNSGQTSGTIKTLGEKVSLISANINTSGSNGGDTVLVSGNYQDEETIPKTQRTLVSSDSTNILSKGVGNAESGGNVTVNTTVPTPSLNPELGAIALNSVELKTGEAQQENQGEIESRHIEKQQGQGNLSFTATASSADVPKNLLDDSTLQLNQQPNPNEGSLVQPSLEPQPSQLRATNPVLPTPIPETPTPSPKAEQPRRTIAVRQSEVVGSRVFSSKEFNPIIPIGFELGINELKPLNPC